MSISKFLIHEEELAKSDNVILAIILTVTCRSSYVVTKSTGRSRSRDLHTWMMVRTRWDPHNLSVATNNSVLAQASDRAALQDVHADAALLVQRNNITVPIVAPLQRIAACDCVLMCLDYHPARDGRPSCDASYDSLQAWQLRTILRLFESPSEYCWHADDVFFSIRFLGLPTAF